MSEEKSQLDSDLTAKLERLALMREQPDFFLSEHFASIRREIDYDTELQLMSPEATSNLRRQDDAKLNETRARFVKLLAWLEEKWSSELPRASEAMRAVHVVLEHRVAEYIAGSTNLVDVEDEYSRLALEIIDATNELERSLLGGQSIVYVPTKRKGMLGNLIYLSETHLSQHERDCFNVFVHKRANFSTSIGLKEIYDETQKSLNKSMLIGVFRPLIFDKNKMVLFGILSLLQTSHSHSNSEFLCLGSKADVPGEKFVSFDGPIIDFYTKLVYLIREVSIDGINLPEITLGSFRGDFFGVQLSVHLNKPMSFDSAFQVDDSFFGYLDSLELCDNRLESLNEDWLAKCNNLRRLDLTEAFLPGTEFGIDFLASLGRLVELKLSLPNTAIDFKVLKSLTELQHLVLRSAASLDSNLEPSTLTPEAFKQLAAIENLVNLELSHFEIASLGPNAFSDFKCLLSLTLSDNRIGEIHQDAFRGTNIRQIHFVANHLGKSAAEAKMLRGLDELDSLYLEHSGIEQLSTGELNAFPTLNHLQLTNNSIGGINFGVFNDLKRLSTLVMSQNPIETIEPGALNCGLLWVLTLENCRLKSIDSRAFIGPKYLSYLEMNNNQIEAIEVIAESETVRVDGILSSKQLEFVRKHLFRDLIQLKSLNLNGNKFTKMDLNCLCNLKSLTELYLASNKIDEINSKICGKTLANLKILNLSNNLLTHIDKDAFSQSTELVRLDLSSNLLEKLAEDFFQPFRKLEHLRLQNNKLSIRITRRTFGSCVKLIELNLRDNRRVQVEDGAFRDLIQLDSLELDLAMPLFTFLNAHDIRFGRLALCNSSLKQDTLFGQRVNGGYTVRNFDLVGNSLESLDDLQLESLFPHLAELDLSQNSFRRFASDWLASLLHLTSLDLSKNMLETLHNPALFQGLPKLTKLNLSGNKLKMIHRHLFKDLYKLESLDLSNNLTLSIIDCSMFRGLLSLKLLNLSGNNIYSLNLSLILSSCRLLESLDLSNNQLDDKSINEESMSGSTAQNLKELILANNRLERMDFVCNLYRLQKLDLSGNKIESVIANDVNLLGRLRKLKHLILSGNLIKSPKEEFLNQWRHLLIYSDNT